MHRLKGISDWGAFRSLGLQMRRTSWGDARRNHHVHARDVRIVWKLSLPASIEHSQFLFNTSNHKRSVEMV